MKNFYYFTFVLCLLSSNAFSQTQTAQDLDSFEGTTNMIEELDPRAEDIEERLREIDDAYEKVTGESAILGGVLEGGENVEEESFDRSSCYRKSCRLWVSISRKTQTATVYVDRKKIGSWKVSTGKKGSSTPNFDRHPNGRIYNRYSSTKFPGGDYQGLGNMPYAVFIKGGYAMHGTPKGNWSKLGRVASHGCIRMLPKNAKIINNYVRRFGVRKVWVTVKY